MTEDGYSEAQADEYVKDLEHAYGEMREQLRWTTAVLCLLIEQHGGVEQVFHRDIESFEDAVTAIQVYESENKETYILEVERIDE